MTRTATSAPSTPMATEIRRLPRDDASAPMPPGETIRLHRGSLEVDLAPAAGGRVARIRFDGVDWLIGPHDGWPDTIAWGCYPMVPWAGRVRAGRFQAGGRAYQLPVNFGGHAIHGLGFSRSWRIESQDDDAATLSLLLPQDGYWPFGGLARQVITLHDHGLRLDLSVQAGDQPMPAVLGWHPWFRKPDRLVFHPSAMYPRDHDGIATLPPVPPRPGPWDDCFIAEDGAVLERARQRLHVTSDCTHWVVYDGAGHATCVEPQTGPPDGFNLAPHIVEPGQTLAVWMALRWS